MNDGEAKRMTDPAPQKGAFWARSPLFLKAPRSIA